MSPITHHHPEFDPQLPFDASVVIPTILRPSLAQAVDSVYAQQGVERIQVLVGVDKALGDPVILEQLIARCPNYCALTIIDLGYSTSIRHGGPHAALDGGAIRSILTLAANSVNVAYLDDDNWWGTDHLTSLLEAIRDHNWAYSKRWFVHGATDDIICEDVWEAVGPGHGVYNAEYGGFVDPNCLMINKIKCVEDLHAWCTSLTTDKNGADRRVFKCLLKRGNYVCTEKVTTFYRLPVSDADGKKRFSALKRMSGR